LDDLSPDYRGAYDGEVMFWLSVAVLGAAIHAVSCGTLAPPERTRMPAAVLPPSESPAQRAAGVCPEDRADEPIAVCNLASSGEFEVRNQSDQPVEVLTLGEIETRTDENSWAVTTALVYLTDDCGQGPPKARCMTLAPRATFRPWPWRGFTCSGQCGPTCPGDHQLYGWPLRFVVVSCDGTRRYAGPPFAPLEFDDVPL